MTTVDMESIHNVGIQVVTDPICEVELTLFTEHGDQCRGEQFPHAREVVRLIQVDLRSVPALGDVYVHTDPFRLYPQVGAPYSRIALNLLPESALDSRPTRRFLHIHLLDSVLRSESPRPCSPPVPGADRSDQ